MSRSRWGHDLMNHSYALYERSWPHEPHSHTVHKVITSWTIPIRCAPGHDLTNHTDAHIRDKGCPSEIFNRYYHHHVLTKWHYLMACYQKRDSQALCTNFCHPLASGVSSSGYAGLMSVMYVRNVDFMTSFIKQKCWLHDIFYYSMHYELKVLPLSYLWQCQS